MSERQLHEPIRVTEVAEFGFAVRSCEMESCSEVQHRTKVNLQAGMLTRASGPSSVTPPIRSWSGCSGGRNGGTSLCLTPGDCARSKRWDDSPTDVVGLCGGNDRRPTSFEESDHLVVVTKLGDAG